MRIATLRLRLTAKKRTAFSLNAEGVTSSYPGPTIAVVDRLSKELGKLEYSTDASQRARVLRRYVDEFVPPRFISWFRQWIANPDEDSVLCVHTDDVRLSNLPWGEILIPTGVPAGRGWVARVCNVKGSSPPRPRASVQMLLAGWAGLTGYTMTGVMRELQELSGKIDKERVGLEVLPEPTRPQLLSACAKRGSSWVHLSPPSLIYEKNAVAIPVAAEARKSGSSRRSSSSFGPSIVSVPLTDLCGALRKNKDLQMVVVNACNAGIAGCREIAETLKTVAIGWPALVADDIAADFTFYFYQRLLEGSSPLLAVRSFARAIGNSRIPIDVPVVWLPSPEWVLWQPLTGAVAAETRADASAQKKRRKPGKPSRTSKSRAVEKTNGQVPTEPATAPETTAGAVPAPAEPPTLREPQRPGLRLEFRPRLAINPALLVNGLLPIEHISIESPSEQEVHLCIVCDTGGVTSTYRQTVRLRTGIVPVPTTEIHFPALHELVERHAHRRRISFTATLTNGDGKEIIGQTRTSLWMGAKEWLDQEDTWAFIPAFVDPFDNGVLTVFELAKKVLRTLGNPSDTFTGYRQNPPSPEYVSTQMKAIFQTLRDDTIGLTYIAPPGSPVFDSGSQRPIGQVVRTHGEVIERKLGTCHDLALLLAACAEYVGIRPLIGLLPGHTFVGYWTSSQSQERYWKERQDRLRTSKFGEAWTITDGEEFFQLVNKEDIALLEPTYVCQREKTFKEACTFRMDALKKTDRELLDVVVDIYSARREVQPI